MVSNFKESKYYFEKLFIDSWIDTPVHFVGQEFDASGLTQWVNPRYTPSGGSLKGLSGGRTQVTASLDIICWAKNEVEVFDLSDKIVAFMASKATEFTISKFEVNDHGWDDSNMVYLYLTFDIKYYMGACTATPPPTQPQPISQVVNNGLSVVNGADSIIN